MTDFDTEFVPLALEMLNDDGCTVSVETYPSASYNKATGDTTLGSKTAYSLKAIPPFEYSLRMGIFSGIKQGQLVSGIAASGLSFNPESVIFQIVFDSKTFSVEEVKPIYSGDSIALYLFGLKT